MNESRLYHVTFDAWTKTTLQIYELKDAEYFVNTDPAVRALTRFVLTGGHTQLDKSKMFQSNGYAEINIINLQAKAAELRWIIIGFVNNKSLYRLIKYNNAILI